MRYLLKAVQAVQPTNFAVYDCVILRKVWAVLQVGITAPTISSGCSGYNRECSSFTSFTNITAQKHGRFILVIQVGTT